MPKQALEEALGAVRKAMDSSDTLDATDVAALGDLRDDIERALGSTEELARRAPAVQAGTLSVVERFEVSNPTLTAVLDRLATVLSSLGI